MATHAPLCNPIRIIGLGNPLAGDDAVGVVLVNKLTILQLSGIDILTAKQAPLDILEYLEGAQAAILIDAMQSGREMGTIVRLEIPRDLDQLTSVTWLSGTASTHLFGLGEALSLGSELRTLPSNLIIYGIELGQTQMGECLSPRIAESIEVVVKRIVKDIIQLTYQNTK